MIRSYSLCIYTTLLLTTGAFAGFFTPRYSLSFEGGATESYLESNGHMEYFFEPTSDVNRSMKPSFTFSFNMHLGKYLGLSTGLGYTHFGQSTSPTTVYFSDDIYGHEFESRMHLHYITVPFILKAGIRISRYSVFLRGGIIPSLIANNDEINWIIDGKTQGPASKRVPDVELRPTDAPLHFGGEAGIHLGKNGLFLLLQYNYGFRNVAYGISGHVTVRSYGATLQYRREL